MIIHGDCLEKLKELPDNSVDSVCTDPPYGWRFMGKAWDGADIEKVFARDKTLETDNKTTLGMAAGKYNQSLVANHAFQTFSESYAKELYRVLKPGGHMLVFCGPRTYHRMASGVEDAGFEIRDQLQWLFGSGFPKSHNIGNGIGTALKPANEPIVLARKPLEKGLTVAQNVLKWGVGGLNIDASRIAGVPRTTHAAGNFKGKQEEGSIAFGAGLKDGFTSETPQGRWPANLILDETAAEMLDEQSGVSKSPKGKITGGGFKTGKYSGTMGIGEYTRDEAQGHGDHGGASRFFYVAKSSKKDRSSNGMVNNIHPTCKPTKLMEYLIRLITPPGGIVLDPFMGSGSTGVAAFKNGFKFIGIEMNEEYVEIAKKRLEHAKGPA